VLAGHSGNSGRVSHPTVCLGPVGCLERSSNECPAKQKSNLHCLASDASSFITGQYVNIDGGMTSRVP